MIDQVQEIKERSDIVEIVSSYLTLKRAGTNFKAPCPFHKEKSPSFMVSAERQSFRCFGCSEGGDVITFIEKMEGLDFYNALKLLADRAGVTLKTDSVKYGQSEHRADQKTRIFEINEWAKKVYQKLFSDHPKAERARDYILKKREMSKKIAEEFEIGYAPESWDFLLRFLRNKKYEDKEVVLAGLAIKSERGKIYDRFRGRVVFPINNIIGNTIAFTTRILDDTSDQAKYINSAESPIYIKGKTIYGLDKAKKKIKEENLAILVEGNMDVIACHQAGYENTVAVSGTALTENQLKSLSRYASIIAFCFDMDIAGQTAMRRAIRIALANDISTKVIVLPDGIKDPDEAIKKDRKIWESAIKKAKPSMQYLIDAVAPPNQTLSIDDKKKAAKEILPVIKIIFSEIEKEHYIKYLAERLNVSEDSLISAMEKTKTTQEFGRDNSISPTKEQHRLTGFEKTLAYLWFDHELLNKVDKEFEDIIPDGPATDFIVMVKNKKIDKSGLKVEVQNLLDTWVIEAIDGVDKDQEGSIENEFLYQLGRMRSQKREDVKEVYARKIKEAESTGDKEKLKQLLEEFSQLLK